MNATDPILATLARLGGGRKTSIENRLAALRRLLATGPGPIDPPAARTGNHAGVIAAVAGQLGPQRVAAATGADPAATTAALDRPLADGDPLDPDWQNLLRFRVSCLEACVELLAAMLADVLFPAAEPPARWEVVTDRP
ncbi:MAG TPA: hypothetical protein VKE74_30865 [Gemmataceae bacterium]|nr:hypothetical protein [Gemmataceae bacterium]